MAAIDNLDMRELCLNLLINELNDEKTDPLAYEQFLKLYTNMRGTLDKKTCDSTLASVAKFLDVKEIAMGNAGDPVISGSLGNYSFGAPNFLTVGRLGDVVLQAVDTPSRWHAVMFYLPGRQKIAVFDTSSIDGVVHTIGKSSSPMHRRVLVFDSTATTKLGCAGARVWINPAQN